MKPIDPNLWWEKNLDDGYKWNEFCSWLSMSDRSSRFYLYKFINDHKSDISSVLEIGPGSFIDYETYFSKQSDIQYSCIDITTKIIEKAKSKNIEAKLGSIKNIPYNNYFDLVYTRHVLEHIDYYIEAIHELIKISDKYVICTFFYLDKTSNKDTITIEEKTKLYHNKYSKNKLNKFLDLINIKYEWYECKQDNVLIIYKNYDIIY